MRMLMLFALLAFPATAGLPERIRKTVADWPSIEVLAQAAEGDLLVFRFEGGQWRTLLRCEAQTRVCTQVSRVGK